MRRVCIAWMVTFLICLPVSAGDFLVIVNAGNGVTSLSHRDVSKLFLKKQTTWPSGVVVSPVDQVESAAIRVAFTDQIHKRPLTVLQKYWLKQAFSGTSVKPDEKSSDSDVINYVAENKGGIGYVSAGTELPDTVKVVTLSD